MAQGNGVILDWGGAVPLLDWFDIVRDVEIHQFCGTIRYVVNVASRGGQQETYGRKLAFLEEIARRLDELSILCEGTDLPMTQKVIGPMKEVVLAQIGGGQVDFSSIFTAANVLATRLEDELSLRKFFELEPAQAARFKNPLKDWEAIIARFPASRQNVEESSKCFAFERYGAAVFHILLVAEYGVIGLAKLLKAGGDKPGWGSLAGLQRILKKPYPDRSEFEKQHSALLEDVVPLAIVVKDSWRHKLTHADNQIVWMDTDFSPQVAEEITTATRGFMRKLAQDLPPIEE